MCRWSLYGNHMHMEPSTYVLCRFVGSGGTESVPRTTVLYTLAVLCLYSRPGNIRSARMVLSLFRTCLQLATRGAHNTMCVPSKQPTRGQGLLKHVSDLDQLAQTMLYCANTCQHVFLLEVRIVQYHGNDECINPTTPEYGVVA